MTGTNASGREVTAAWAEQLRDLGLDAKVVRVGTARRGVRHGLLRLGRGSAQCEYALTCGTSVPLSGVGAGADGRPQFVLASFVAAKTADAFRRGGIQYLDQAGNAWIEFGDVFVDVRGRPRPAARIRPNRGSGNLFSSGRAQVVFALLAWPQLWDATQRRIAHAAGVSVGQVNDTLKLLKQSGYTRDGVRPGQPDLLDLWAAAFPSGLAERLTLARYAGTGPIRAEWLKQMSASAAAAVPDLVRSSAAVYYIDDMDVRVAIAHKWRSDGEPNITVRRRFWTAPADENDKPKRDRLAPWPLVYADLLASDDPRERAAAKEWRDRHARPEQRA